MQDLKMADYKLIEVKDLAGESFQTMIDIDGHRLTTFTKPPEVAAEIVHNIANMELREDDIMFCTAAKSGTHWGFEIISMLVNGKAESIPVHKEQTMLEVIPQSEMKKLQSPRVLNSHVSLSLLPKQLKEKKTKIVLILRNLKDMSVSFFHHHTGVKFYGYSGKFKDYLPVLLNGELDYGDWFSYVKEWEEAMESNDYNIHLLFFEDLKENGVAEIKKIAKFIGVPENDELCEAICDKCHFDKMAAVKQFPDEVAQKYFKNNFSMYRKGQIGDWKNHYTVAMSEEFDKLYDKKMKDSKLKFRYTPARI